MSRLLFCLCALLFIDISAAAQSDWPRASAESAGISRTKLQAMETAIKSGEFKKIGSILIARDGKLVYEGYFDGDASTLRDTRSATKSITSILIGLAVQEKKLSSVSVRVLDLLPEHQRSLQYPDPRKE